MSSGWINSIYAPKPSETNNWQGGLSLNASALLQNLRSESSIYQAIQTCGQHLYKVRTIIAELERDGTITPQTIPSTSAQEVNKLLSMYFRTPEFRFYNSMILMHSIVRACFSKEGPESFSTLPWTTNQYHAVVTYTASCQILLIQPGDDNSKAEKREKMIGETIRAFKSCVKAQPSDPKIVVSFANFLMVNGFTQDAREYFEKAIDMDERDVFGSHYSMANMIQNVIPSAEQVNTLKAMERCQAIAFTHKAKKHLELYLKFAPKGHWHIHRACIQLMEKMIVTTWRGSENIEKICKRVPNFAASMHDLFQRACTSYNDYVRTFGREQGDFKSMFRQMAALISTMHSLNLVKGKFKPDCEYICGNPTCFQHDYDDDSASQVNKKATKALSKCSKCFSVRYCSRSCQVAHWKNEHKAECKMLASQREECIKIPKAKRLEVKLPQIGG